METGVVERVLRALPGVLDCSVHDEGIAVVVHPEVDPRVIEVRAQVALAEVGERRPLLVVGGMSSGAAEPLPPPRRPGGRAGRAGRSPVSLLGFAILVVSLITVVPIATREAGDGPVAAPPLAGEAPSASDDEPSWAARLPVVDERLVAAVAGPVGKAVAPVLHGVAAVASTRTGAPAVSVPVALSHDGAPPPPAPGTRKADAKGTGTGKGKGKDKGKADAEARGWAKRRSGGDRVQAAAGPWARGRR